MVEIDTPDEVAPDREPLAGREEDLLEAYFERGLEDTRDEDTETVVEKIREYMPEVKSAAEIARAQFDQRFGGMQAQSGRFAVSRVRSGYFGYDSWEGNIIGPTAGQLNTWINDGKPDQLGGTDTSFGNPLKVGENAVHVLLGLGELGSTVGYSSIKYELNEEPRSSIQVKWELTKTDIGIKWFDRPIVLPENALFEAQVYTDVSVDANPYFVGVSFIEDRASLDADPANMTDDSTSTSDNIVAQG